MDLTTAWALVVGFAGLMYLLLDGFDLGVGALLLTTRDERERDLMVASIAPVWDGNETWIVLAGAGLLGGFPKAYGILLPAFYVPLFTMLMALAFRGTAFEFRFQAERNRWAWDLAFSAGSIVAALCQGVMIGGLVHGVTVRSGEFAGGPLDFLSPASALSGIAVVFGYATIGAAWLNLKSEGALQERAQRLGRVALPLFATAYVAVVTLGTPAYAAGTLGARPLLSATKVLTVATLGSLAFASIGRRRPAIGFLLCVATVAAYYGNLVLTLWPCIVPPDVTIWDAAAPPRSQALLLAGACLLIPVILAYTGFSYWVFRGKTELEAET